MAILNTSPQNAQRNLEIVGQLGYYLSEQWTEDTNRFFRQGLTEGYTALVRCLGPRTDTYGEVPVIARLLETIQRNRVKPYPATQKEINDEQKARGCAYVYSQFLQLTSEHFLKEAS